MLRIFQEWRERLKDLHVSWCVFGAVFGVIFGTILVVATSFSFCWHWLWVVAGVILVVLGIWRPSVVGVVLAFVGGVLVAEYRGSFELLGAEVLGRMVYTTVVMTGVVAEDPDTTESKTALRLKALVVGGESEVEVAGTLYVALAPNEKIQRSDRVTLQGKLGEGFGTFAGTMYRPGVVSLERPEPGDVLLKVRNWFAGNVRAEIESPAADLGLGYLLGVRSSLPEDLLEVLKVVGLTHIIVASGANLSILVRFSRKVFGRISRWAGLVVSAVLVILMVGMIGLTASMSRAAAVTLLSLLAWYVGRSFGPVRLLGLVAAITLLANPMYVLDMGWLLSFAAFAGIMVVGPILIRVFYGEKEPKFLMGVLIETLSASILCMPILLYSFGKLSLISLAANLLVLPTIPAAMALTFLTGVLGFWPMVAGMVGWVAERLLDFHLWVIYFLGGRTEFLVEIPEGNPLVFLLYLPIIGGIVVYLVYESKVRRRTGRVRAAARAGIDSARYH